MKKRTRLPRTGPVSASSACMASREAFSMSNRPGSPSSTAARSQPDISAGVGRGANIKPPVSGPPHPDGGTCRNERSFPSTGPEGVGQATLIKDESKKNAPVKAFTI